MGLFYTIKSQDNLRVFFFNFAKTFGLMPIFQFFFKSTYFYGSTLYSISNFHFWTGHNIIIALKNNLRLKIELYEREKMICLFSHTIKLFNFSTTFACVLFNVDGDWLKHLFYPHSDPFSSEAVKYREEMMRTPAALIYPSGASASHNEGISFIK